MNARGVRAPSPMLPLGFLAVAALAFALATLALPWLGDALTGHYYHPRILALTHTLTLGWITVAILGASYQLIPIVLERPVWSERLGRWELALITLGVIGVVGHVAIASWSGFVWSAALVAAGVMLHVVNTALTLRGLEHRSFTASMLVMGFAGLVLTTAFGAALGVEHVRTFLPGDFFARLHAHVHLALLGWVLPMVIGVAARVYPMFLLAREPAGWPGRVQLWGLGFGVPAVVVGILASPGLLGAGALAL
ncbi:MAG TPA: cbb3-type cytochrome c oxidase subunit I, partial [Methylomirabilota bacterium]|nr:cbb3-type cytochrome c oxidase subunit I [Methylomirabilota bacterium]